MSEQSLDKVDDLIHAKWYVDRCVENGDLTQKGLRGMNYAEADHRLTCLLQELKSLRDFLDRKVSEEKQQVEPLIAEYVRGRNSRTTMTIQVPELREFYPEKPYSKRYDVTLEGDFAVYRVPVTPQVYWIWPHTLSEFDRLEALNEEGTEWEFKSVRMTGTVQVKTLKVWVDSELANALGFVPPQFTGMETSKFHRVSGRDYKYDWNGYLGVRDSAMEGYVWENLS